MKIGILGTGRMGVRLAAMYARAGHEVVLGSRDTERSRRIAAGLALPGLASGDYDQALDAPVVLPAIFLRDGLLDQLEPLRTVLAGKILIDITNPFNADYTDFITPWDTSGAERMTLLSGELGTRLGFFPRMNYTLLGTPWKPGQADEVVGALIARPDGDAR